jgi:hypothetical protein
MYKYIYWKMTQKAEFSQNFNTSIIVYCIYKLFSTFCIFVCSVKNYMQCFRITMRISFGKMCYDCHFYIEVGNHFVQTYNLCNPYSCAPFEPEKILAAQLRTCNTNR